MWYTVPPTGRFVQRPLPPPDGLPGDDGAALGGTAGEPGRSPELVGGDAAGGRSPGRSPVLSVGDSVHAAKRITTKVTAESLSNFCIPSSLLV